jgi:ferredoxin
LRAGDAREILDTWVVAPSTTDPGAEMRVWIDQDLCTGDGLCTDHCPELFVLLNDGISYVRDQSTGQVASDPGGRSCQVVVPQRFETKVIDAAMDCPGECIFVEEDATYAPRQPSGDAA